MLTNWPTSGAWPPIGWPRPMSGQTDGNGSEPAPSRDSNGTPTSRPGPSSWPKSDDHPDDEVRLREGEARLADIERRLWLLEKEVELLRQVRAAGGQ